MVGSRYGKQHLDSLHRGPTCKVIVKSGEIAVDVYLIGKFLLEQKRIATFETWNSIRHERASMGDYDFYIRIAYHYIMGHHIEDSPRRLCRILVDKSRPSCKYTFVDRRRLDRMQDDNGISFVKHLHEWVKHRVSEIFPVYACSQLHTISIKGVKRIDRLLH